jgi:hypothetical protein
VLSDKALELFFVFVGCKSLVGAHIIAAKFVPLVGGGRRALNKLFVCSIIFFFEEACD